MPGRGHDMSSVLGTACSQVPVTMLFSPGFSPEQDGDARQQGSAGGMARLPALTSRCADPGAGVSPGRWRIASQELREGSTKGPRPTRRRRGCAQGNPLFRLPVLGCEPISARCVPACQVPGTLHKFSAVRRTATMRLPTPGARDRAVTHTFSTFGWVGWWHSAGSVNARQRKDQAVFGSRSLRALNGRTVPGVASGYPCTIRCSPRESWGVG
jgi:hypothetical protein